MAYLAFCVSFYKKTNQSKPNKKTPSHASIFVKSVCMFIPIQTSKITAKLSQPTNPNHSWLVTVSSKEEIKKIFKESVI